RAPAPKEGTSAQFIASETKRRSGPRSPWTKSGGDRTGNPRGLYPLDEARHPDFGESNFFATQLNEVTQLSCGRGADRATLLEVVEGSLNIDGQYDRDTGAMLFQLHRYIETWVGPRCPEYEGGCAVCYMWAIYDKLAKYTQ